MAKSKFSMEDAFSQLDAILTDLNNPDIGLADSMDLYKKGVKLLERCNKAIDKTEKEIIILQEGQHADIIEGRDMAESEED